LIVPSVPSIGAGVYPNVLTPAFVVPSSILLHALSLRQLRRRGRAAAVRRYSAAAAARHDEGSKGQPIDRVVCSHPNGYIPE
jgi:hypothetical protein